MIKLSTPSKKNIIRTLEKFNQFLSNNLNYLNIKNFNNIFFLFIYDRRFLITLSIIIISIFAHLSSPAFYKPEWLTKKIKKQLEDEFNITFVFNDNVKYSMFPVPNFAFKKVKLLSGDEDLKEFALLEDLKIYLSYKKFFDKEKLNIQYIKVKNSQFSLHDIHLKGLINFFDNKINKKKLTILKSKIFFKDEANEIFSILNINKSFSFFDELEEKNVLVLEGDIFNNPLKLVLNNNYVLKDLELEIDFPKLQKTFTNNFSYKDKKKYGKILLTSIGNNHSYKFDYEDKKLKFYSEEFSNNLYKLSGITYFNPFSTEIDMELKSIDLKKILSKDNFFYSILRSGIFLNENLNYKINLKSKDISNHRKLKYLSLNINYNQKEFNLNNSSIKFSDIATLNISDSAYINNNLNENFYADILIDIHNSKKLFSYFQTQKDFRKKIGNIKLQIIYDFLDDTFRVGEIKVDGKSSEEIENFIKNFNHERKLLNSRINIKNFFNEFIELF